MLTNIKYINQATFSTFPVAKGLMATALLALDYLPSCKQEDSRNTKITNNSTEHSYQETEILNYIESQHLTIALQNVYERILSNQKEFDSETKKILYENL